MEIEIKGLNEKVIGLSQLASGAFGGPLSPILSAFGLKILNEIKSTSPTGEKHGGSYKSAWNIVSLLSRGDVLASIKFTNQLPYAIHMEDGSIPGKRPWPSEGPRTVLRDGRIWSSQYPQPVAGTAIEDANYDQLREQIFSILKEFL